MQSSKVTKKEASRPTRGRPAHTPTQVADVRAHIAARALDLFAKEGYAGISMRRLATEAGYTPMTLYKYFENKFAILRMLWSDVFIAMFDQLDSVAAAEKNANRRLEAVAMGYVEFWLDHRDHYFLVFMSGGISQDDVSLFMADEKLLARFDLLRSCIADTFCEKPSPEELRVRGEVLLCGLNGVAQALITMSGYPWSDRQVLVRGVIAGALAA